MHPEWNSYFWIAVPAGSGFTSGSWTMGKAAISDIMQSLDAGKVNSLKERGE